MYHRRGYPDQPLITGPVDISEETYIDRRVISSIEIYDTTMLYSDEPLGQMYGSPTGANVLAEVRKLLNSIPSPPPALLAESPAQLTADLIREGDTSKLEFINLLLGAAGLGSLYADPTGFLRADAPQDLNYADAKWSFNYDDNSFRLPGWNRRQAKRGVPNRVRAIRAVNGSAPADIAVAQNTNPASPFSYQAQGDRWVTHEEYNVPASDFTALQRYADSRLLELTQAGTQFSFQHPILPFSVGDVVEFEHPLLDPLRVVCVGQRIQCSSGSMVSSTFEEVVSV
jgi:hypothetical protein